MELKHTVSVRVISRLKYLGEEIHVSGWYTLVTWEHRPELVVAKVHDSRSEVIEDVLCSKLPVVGERNE